MMLPTFSAPLLCHAVLLQCQMSVELPLAPIAYHPAEEKQVARTYDTDCHGVPHNALPRKEAASTTRSCCKRVFHPHLLIVHS